MFFFGTAATALHTESKAMQKVKRQSKSTELSASPQADGVDIIQQNGKTQNMDIKHEFCTDSLPFGFLYYRIHFALKPRFAQQPISFAKNTSGCHCITLN